MQTKKPSRETYRANDPSSASPSALPAALQAHLQTLGLSYMEAHAAAAAAEAARAGTAHLAYLEALAAGESAAQHDGNRHPGPVIINSAKWAISSGQSAITSGSGSAPR